MGRCRGLGHGHLVGFADLGVDERGMAAAVKRLGARDRASVLGGISSRKRVNSLLRDSDITPFLPETPPRTYGEL